VVTAADNRLFVEAVLLPMMKADMLIADKAFDADARVLSRWLRLTKRR
jgi:hypothetical protein